MTPEQRKHFEYVRDVIHGDEEKEDKFCDNNCVWTDHHPDCIRAEPEWYHVIDVHGCNRFYHKTEDCPYEFKKPLYTTPYVARIAWVNATTWRGLTEEEREQMVDMVLADKKTKDQIGDLQRMVEAKLREKNSL